MSKVLMFPNVMWLCLAMSLVAASMALTVPVSFLQEHIAMKATDKESQVSTLKQGENEIAQPTSTSFVDTLVLSDGSYKRVAELRNDVAMKRFIRRLLLAHGKTVDDEGALNGFVPWFSGTKATQNLPEMKKQLFQKEWVVDASSSVQPKPQAQDPQPLVVSALKRGTSLPTNGRVAIVIRGEAFRMTVPAEKWYDNGAATISRLDCQKEKHDDQINTTRTLVSNVVEPLEKLGNKVDIIAGIDKKCKMMSEILELLGHGRILATPDVKALDQSRAMRLALDGFKSAIQGVEVADQYDLIFIVRHDIIWKQPITVFNTDFSNLNFADWCKYFDKCLNDIVQVMPGRIFTVFDSMVNQPPCFDVTAKPSCHFAFAQLSQKLSDLKETAVVSVLVDFRLKEGVRDVNPYMELMSLLA